MTRIFIGVAVSIALCWIALVIVLFAVRPKGSLLKEAVRLVPDVLRLLRRIASDPASPRGVRVRLWLLFVYLAIPFDLIPDIVPVLGYADDAIIVALALRSVVRRAGPDAVRRHWPGTEDGLAALWRIAGLGGVTPPEA